MPLILAISYQLDKKVLISSFLSDQ